MPELSKLIVWLILGALTGYVVGPILARKKEGLGLWKNIGVGLAGALVGGIVFRVFKIDLGLGQIAITAEDLVASILGAFLFVLILWILKKAKKT